MTNWLKIRKKKMRDGIWENTYLYTLPVKSKLILIFVFCYSVVSSQSDPLRNSAFTVRGSANIPGILGSQAFKQSFRGIYDGNVSVNANVFSNFYVGIGYYNALYNRARRPEFENANLKTRLQLHGAFLKLGYDHFFSERGYFSFALNAGYAYNFYTGVSRSLADTILPSNNNTFTCPFLMPEISANFVTSPHLAFGLIVSWQTLLYRYNPRIGYMDGYLNYAKLKNNSNMNWLNIGFSCNVLLGKNNLKHLDLQ